MLNYLKQIAFGLDISSSAVSILKIIPRGRRLKLWGFNVSSLASGLILSGRIQDEKFLSEIIKKTAAGCRPHKIRDLFVNLSLPEQVSYLRVVQLPLMTFNEVKEAIKWEIEANIPFPIDSVYYDWQILKSPSGLKFDHLDILVAAVPKEIVDSYIRVVKQAGFFPKSIETDPFSLSRAIVPGGFSRDPVLIVELSAYQATLVIFFRDSPRFSSTIPLSGRYFAEMAAAKWEVEEKEAFSDIKKKDGSVPIFSNFLIEQIRSYLEFYEDHAEHDHRQDYQKINKIILSGSGIFAGLTELLEARLKIKAEIANPFVNLSKDPKVDFGAISIEQSLALSKVLGLAAKDFLNPLTTDDKNLS